MPDEPTPPATDRVPQAGAGAEAVARLLAERGLPRRRGALPTTLGTLFGAAAVVLGGGGLLLDRWDLFAACAIAWLAAHALFRTSGALADARAALAAPELDRQWLGPLIEALVWPGGRVRRVARLRLTTLLPTITDEDAARLTPAQRSTLFGQLDPLMAHRHPDFVCAGLRAAEHFDDEHAVATVEGLAQVTAWTPTLDRVRTTARACLPLLEDRLARSGRIAIGARTAEAAPEYNGSEALSPEARRWLAEVEADAGKQPGMRFGYLVASWCFIVPGAGCLALRCFTQGSWVQGVLWTVVSLGATQLYRMTLTPQQERLARKLAEVDDVQAVGPLAELMVWPEPRIQQMALTALTRLLPRLRSSDTNLLSARQRAILYNTLRLSNAGAHADFLVALLRALEQVGDPAAVPFVERLANAEAATLRQRRICDAARNCLPYLNDRAAHTRNSQVLLRAAAADGPPSERLLRAARAQTDADPNLLLRTVVHEDEE